MTGLRAFAVFVETVMALTRRLGLDVDYSDHTTADGLRLRIEPEPWQPCRPDTVYVSFRSGSASYFYRFSASSDAEQITNTTTKGEPTMTMTEPVIDQAEHATAAPAPSYRKLPPKPKGEFPAWLNSETLPEGLEFRIRSASNRLWLLLPEFLDATIEAWNVAGDYGSLDLPDSEGRIERRLGADTLFEFLYKVLPGLTDCDDPEERLAAQQLARNTAEEARATGEQYPAWLAKLDPSADRSGRSTLSDPPADNDTEGQAAAVEIPALVSDRVRSLAAMHPWVDTAKLVDPVLTAEAVTLADEVDELSGRLGDIAERARVVLDGLNAGIESAGEAITHTDAAWEAVGYNHLHNAVIELKEQATVPGHTDI